MRHHMDQNERKGITVYELCLSTSLPPSGHSSFPSHLNLQFPDGVICEYLLISQGHRERSEATPPSLWPVSLALYLSPLLQVGDHDDGWGSLLPHQTPEIHQRLRQRS